MTSHVPFEKFVIRTRLPDFWLRELGPEDAPQYLRMLQSNQEHIRGFAPVDVPMIDTEHRTTKSIAQSFSVSRKNHYTFGMFYAYENSPVLVGKLHLVKLSKHHPGTWELGGFTDKCWTRRGFGSHARNALARWVLTNFHLIQHRHLSADPCRRVVSQPNIKNEASCRMLYRAGFRYVRRSNSQGVTWKNFVFTPDDL